MKQRRNGTEENNTQAIQDYLENWWAALSTTAKQQLLLKQLSKISLKRQLWTRLNVFPLFSVLKLFLRGFQMFMDFGGQWITL